MKWSRSQRDFDTDSGLIRLGGLAILLGLAIHIVLNMVLKQFPPENPSKAELQTYLSEQASTWAIVHGLRYVAFLCITLFASGLFARTSRGSGLSKNAWGIVGLLGCAIWLASAMVTNGIETLAFLDLTRLSGNLAIFWAIFHLTRVLWTAEIAAWSIFILGFSMAGWLSGTLPKWLALLGFLGCTAQMLSAIFVVSILKDGWAAPLIEVASMTGLAWFLCTGLYLLLRGAAVKVDSVASDDSRV